MACRVGYNLFIGMIAMLCSCVHESNRGIVANSLEIDNIETKAIVKYYINQELKKDSILLLENPYEFTNTLSLKKATHDLGLSNVNLEELVSNSQKYDQAWSRSSMPFVKLISKHDVTDDLRTETGYDKLKKVGYEGFYVLSYPILLESNLAVMYVEFHCGTRCGYGTLVSFRKETSGWRIYKSYQEVVF